MKFYKILVHNKYLQKRIIRFNQFFYLGFEIKGLTKLNRLLVIPFIFKRYYGQSFGSLNQPLLQDDFSVVQEILMISFLFLVGNKSTHLFSDLPP